MLYGVAYTGPLNHPDGNQIQRLDERFPEPGRTVEPAGVVLRSPDTFELLAALHDRRIIEYAGRGKPALQRG